jgi:hypothetical protein
VPRLGLANQRPDLIARQRRRREGKHFRPNAEIGRFDR